MIYHLSEQHDHNYIQFEIIVKDIRVEKDV